MAIKDFLAIFDLHSLIVKNVFDCCLSSVIGILRVEEPNKTWYYMRNHLRS